jgi:hypothetical protein
MLARIVGGGAMLKALLEWLYDENHRAVVIMFASGFGCCVGAYWAWFTWRNPASNNERKELEYFPGRSLPQNIKQKPLRQFLMICLGGAVGGLIALLFVGNQVASPPEITLNYRVCRGQYEGECPPHDVFISCNDFEQWAKNVCIKHELTVLSSRDGNMCGYIVANVACTKQVPK